MQSLNYFAPQGTELELCCTQAQNLNYLRITDNYFFAPKTISFQCNQRQRFQKKIPKSRVWYILHPEPEIKLFSFQGQIFKHVLPRAELELFCTQSHKKCLHQRAKFEIFYYPRIKIYPWVTQGHSLNDTLFYLRTEFDLFCTQGQS